MINFINCQEINELKKGYNFLLARKLYQKEQKNFSKFKLKELPLNRAIQVYIHILNYYLYENIDTTEIDKIMISYFEEINYINDFLTRVDKYVQVHSEDDDYLDDWYDIYEEVCDEIYTFLLNYMNVYETISRSTYSIVYDYNELDIQEQTVWKEIRDRTISNAGGYSHYNYNIETEEDEDELVLSETNLYDSMQTESTITTICSIYKSSINDYYTRVLCRTFSDIVRYNGGLSSSAFFETIGEETNFYLDITMDLCYSINRSTFIMIAIIAYFIKKGGDLVNETNNRIYG